MGRLQLGDGKNHRGKRFRCPKCGSDFMHLQYIPGDTLVICLGCEKYMSSASNKAHWPEVDKTEDSQETSNG